MRASRAGWRARVPLWRQTAALFAKNSAKNGGPVTSRGQAAASSPAPRAGNSQPVAARRSAAPPHSNQSLQAHQEKAAGRAWSTSRVLRCRIPGGRGPFLDSFLDRFWVVSRPEFPAAGGWCWGYSTQNINSDEKNGERRKIRWSLESGASKSSIQPNMILVIFHGQKFDFSGRLNRRVLGRISQS